MDTQTTRSWPRVWIPLYFGSFWGLTEATAGHLLHWLQIPGAAGFLMFPVGIYFMTQAFHNSGKLSTIFLTSQVASGIKLIDFFLPARSLFAVINPALAILCEGLVVLVLFSMRRPRESSLSLFPLWVTAFTWRLLYGFVVIGLSSFFKTQSFGALGASSLARFFLIDSLANGIIISAVLRSQKKWKGRLFPNLQSLPALSPVVFLAVALAAELML